MAETNAASSSFASGVLANQLNPAALKSLDDLGERIDNAAHVPVAGFHPLDRRLRYPGQLGQLLLVDAEQGAGRAHLS